MAQPLRNKNIQNDPNVNGQITQTIFNIGGASPILNSPFVVLAADPNLTNERILTAGTAITLTDNGPNSSIVVDIADTAVAPGTYSLATVTVDQKGRITSASSGTAPSAQNTLFNDTGTNANLVFLGGKLNADTSRRWSATVSGDLVWGDGTAPKVRLNYASGSQLQIVDASNNAADLSLSTLRGNAAIFSTPNTFNVSFETRTTGDANPRFQVQGSGLIGIGGGASGMDTYLWRSGNAELSLGSSPTTADAYLRATGIKTASGDFTINPTGSNVNFSNKNLTGVATLTAGTSITTPSIASASGDLVFAPVANANFSNKNVIGVGSLTANSTLTATGLTTATGDLSINSATGLINLNTTGLNNVNYVKYTAAGQTIVRGVTNGTIEITDGGFNPGSIKVSNIYTTTGDLVLSPAGSNINCSGKNLINVNLPSSSLSFPIVYTSSASTNQFLKTNVTGDSYERWSVDASGMQAWGPGGAAIFPDTWLYRTAVGEMTLSGQIPQNGNLSGTLLLNTIRGVSNLNLTVASGNINFSNKPATNMSTLSVNGATSSGTFSTFQNSDATVVFSNTTSANTTAPSFAINAAGGLIWASTAGPSAADVSLWRSGANALGIGSVNGSNSGGRLVVDQITATSTLQLGCGAVPNSNTVASTLAAQAIIASISVTLSSTAQHQAIIASSGGSLTSGGNRNLLLGCSGGTISAGSSNCIIGGTSTNSISGGNNGFIVSSPGATITATNGSNIIMGAGNGNTTIGGTSGGSFLWGSYVSTNQPNVFGLSDSVATAVSCSTSNTFYTRFTGPHYFTSNAAGSVGVTLAGGANSWTSVSDETLKKVHCEIEGVLDKVEKLRVVKYNYLCDEEEGRCEARIGMIAQEVNGLYGEIGVAKHFDYTHPNATEEKPIQRVCGDEVAYLAIAAIKEMREELRVTRDENKELRDGLRNTMTVVKGLSNRLKAAEGKLALVGTSVGTFDKL